MKTLIKISLFLAIILILLIFALHVFVNIKGKEMLIQKLSVVFQREVKVGEVKTRLPFNLIIKDLQAKDFFKIDEVLAEGGVFDILRGNFILSRLIVKRAVVDIQKPAAKPLPSVENKDTQASPVSEPSPDKNSTATSAPAILPKVIPANAFEFPRIAVKRFIILDSIFNISDNNTGDKGIKVTLKNLNVKIDNLHLPVESSEITSFEFKGRVPWENMAEEGKVKFVGWINLFKKDMQATLRIEDIDGVYLYPYYSSWVELDKSRIEKATLNFSSEILGLKNDVTADCHLELTRIAFKPRSEEEPQQKVERIATAVIDIFKALNQGKIVLDFKFKTKMDSPDFVLGEIIKLAMHDKITQARKNGSLTAEDILKMPAKVIGETISTATDLTKSVINGTMSVGRELKKAIEGTFTREKEAVPEFAVNQTAQEADQTKQ
jgi:hypothetical protein